MALKDSPEKPALSIPRLSPISLLLPAFYVKIVTPPFAVSRNNNLILSIANCTTAARRNVSTVHIDDLFRTIGNWSLIAYARVLGPHERPFRARSRFSRISL